VAKRSKLKELGTLPSVCAFKSLRQGYHAGITRMDEQSTQAFQSVRSSFANHRETSLRATLQISLWKWSGAIPT
jgi:hypothetical protein